MAKRADHGAFEDAEPDLPTCIAELQIMLEEAAGGRATRLVGDTRRMSVLIKTIECLERRQNHLERMD